jgi:hypothetical protein
MNWRDADHRLTLSLAPGSRMIGPSPRPIAVQLAGRPPKTITFNGQRQEVTL